MNLFKDNNKPTRTTSVASFRPAYIYLFKVNNKNTRKRCEIYSKLTIKTPERHHDVVLVFLLFFNFEHISQLFLVHLLLTLNK